MRAAAFIIFLIAAGLFFTASFYQMKSARNYRRAANQLHVIIADILTNGLHAKLQEDPTQIHIWKASDD